jgi:hypothetical protein
MPKKSRTFRWVLLSLLLFITVNALIIGPDTIKVLETGMCPAGPPDVRPYKCSVGEFLGRMFFSPFAMPGQILILICSCAVGKFLNFTLSVLISQFRKIAR